MLRLCAVALILASSLASSSALAWTSARVRDVRVEVVVDRAASAQVTLDIGVEVLGGFLSRFDLEGLDEELVLADGQAAWLTTAEGLVVPAEAESEAGAITLRFAKGEAARRGLHRVGVRYVAQLAVHAAAGDATEVELGWVLPGWEHGLSRAEIVVRGPGGLTARLDPEQAVQVSQRQQDGRSVLEFVRVLVPRGTPWAVTLSGPAAVFAADPRPAPGAERQRTFSSGFSLTGAWLVLLVLGLGVASRRTFRRHAAELGVVTRPAIAASRVRGALLSLLALCAVGAASVSLPVMLAALLGLVWCFVDRVEPVLGIAPLGRFVPLDGRPQRASRARLLRQRLGGSPVADVGTLAGAIGALVLVAVALWRLPQDPAAGYGLLCALPLWAGSSRLRLPRSTDEQLSLLRNAAEASLALSCGMRLVGFSVGEGQASSPRLRIVAATRFSGLLRVDVAVDTRRTAQPLVLIAVVQSASLADRALAGVLRDGVRELSPRGQRVAYVQPIRELGADLERVFSALSAHSQRAVDVAQSQRAA